MSDKTLVEKITEEFTQRYPIYATYFKAEQKEDVVLLKLLGNETTYDLKEIPTDVSMGEDMSKEDMLWLDITNLMSNLVEEVQRDIIRDGLDELREMIQKNLLEISESANIDINTLWLSFECTMLDLKHDFRRMYEE